MSVRTYNPSVRVGNWNEDLCLEEDLLKDFIEKKESGELLIYKATNLLSKILQPVELNSAKNGRICFGDKICLYNPLNGENLSINMSDSQLHEKDQVTGPCGVATSKILNSCYRNTFVVTSCDGSNEAGDYLTYGQHFLLTTLLGIGGDLNLTSDVATFIQNAKKSRLQEVSLTPTLSYLSHWQILHLDPQQRFETEGSPVVANQRIMVNHCKTNQRLCSLPSFSFRTTFGREHEVVAHTFLDSHKAEKQENQWALITKLDDGKQCNNATSVQENQKE